MQAKHWACTQWGSGVSCVCGMAMREGDVILVADRCRNDSGINKDVNYYTFNAKNLPDDARITVNDAGNRFKVSKSNRAVCKTYSINEAFERKKLTFSSVTGTAFVRYAR